MLKKELQVLVDQLEYQLDHNLLEFEKLESITSTLIIDDGFDSLPGHVQDEVYLIDNYELENPSAEDLLKSRGIIESYLKSK